MTRTAIGLRPAQFRSAWWHLSHVGLLLLLPFLADRMSSVSRAASPSENSERVAAARTRCEKEVRSLFASAGVAWPAGEVYLRGLKREGQLEVWARDRDADPFRLVKTYPVTAQSGGPGPKRREGDGQVPEGFYQIDRFNPRSAFHLSLGINYPNASDRLLSDPKSPGSDIFIHGGSASIGCLALGDPAIEQVYLIALESRARPIRVHLFPARMDAPAWPAWRDAQLGARPEFRSLWEQLAVGWNLFERERRIPRCDVMPDGAYHCRSGR